MIGRPEYTLTLPPPCPTNRDQPSNFDGCRKAAASDLCVDGGTSQSRDFFHLSPPPQPFCVIWSIVRLRSFFQL